MRLNGIIPLLQHNNTARRPVRLWAFACTKILSQMNTWRLRFFRYNVCIQRGKWRFRQEYSFSSLKLYHNFIACKFCSLCRLCLLKSFSQVGTWSFDKVQRRHQSTTICSNLYKLVLIWKGLLLCSKYLINFTFFRSTFVVKKWCTTSQFWNIIALWFACGVQWKEWFVFVKINVDSQPLLCGENDRTTSRRLSRNSTLPSFPFVTVSRMQIYYAENRK